MSDQFILPMCFPKSRPIMSPERMDEVILLVTRRAPLIPIIKDLLVEVWAAFVMEPLGKAGHIIYKQIVSPVLCGISALVGSLNLVFNSDEYHDD